MEAHTMEIESSPGQLHVAMFGPEKNGKSTLPVKQSLVRRFDSFLFIVLAILLFLSFRFSAVLYRLGFPSFGTPWSPAIQRSNPNH
jgi:hypothetical protein